MKLHLKIPVNIGIDIPDGVEPLQQRLILSAVEENFLEAIRHMDRELVRDLGDAAEGLHVGVDFVGLAGGTRFSLVKEPPKSDKLPARVRLQEAYSKADGTRAVPHLDEWLDIYAQDRYQLEHIQFLLKHADKWQEVATAKSGKQIYRRVVETA